MKKVTIIGAGFSGLSLAYYLNKSGAQVRILEQSSQPGGLISSPKTPFGIYETAANGFLSNKLVEEFISELGLEPLRPGPEAKKRFIYRGHPRRWPLGFFETWSTLARFLARVFTKSLRPKVNETIHQWGQRVLGPKATQYLLEAALQGIYAGDPHMMSAELIFSKDKAAGPNMGLVSFQDGMGEVISRLTQHLVQRGVEIRYSENVDRLDHESDMSVICTNPHQAAKLLKNSALSFDPPDSDQENYQALLQNARLLEKIELRPITTVTVFFSSAPGVFRGFGILFPKGEGRWPLGILQNTHIFKRKSTKYSETWILAGIDQSDAEIKAQLLTERKVIFREQAHFDDIKITRWPQALPHYTVELKNILEELTEMNQVYLHGNYLGGIGLSKILQRSKNLSHKILK